MSSKKMFWYVVIGLLIAVFGVGLYIANKEPDASPAPGTMPESSFLRIGENAIYVATQPPGSSVNVSVVAIGMTGYVVIHEVDQNDQPTAAIGASVPLAAGEHTDVKVRTDRPLIVGNSYIAMLHADNGNGIYDNEATDEAVIENGSPVWMIFEVEAGASGSELIQL